MLVIYDNDVTFLIHIKSANLDQESLIPKVKKMEITSVTLGMIFSGVAIATLLIIIYGSRGSKDKEH